MDPENTTDTDVFLAVLLGKYKQEMNIHGTVSHFHFW